MKILGFYDADATTFHGVFKFRHLLTPIAVDYAGLAKRKGYLQEQYRTLYIFGIRVATWRVDVK